MTCSPRRNVLLAACSATLTLTLVVGGCGETTPEKKETPATDSSAATDAGKTKAKKGKMEVKSIKGRIGAGSEKLE